MIQGRLRSTINLALLALTTALLSGCSGDDLDEWLESSTRSWSSESSSSVERAKHVLLSEQSGYSDSETKDFEKKYGHYFGTFEGVSIFGIRQEIDESGKRLMGTAVTKQALKKLTISGEIEDGGGLSEFKVEQENEAHPFKRMKFEVGYGTPSEEQQPTLRITSVEKRDQLGLHQE